MIRITGIGTYFPCEKVTLDEIIEMENIPVDQLSHIKGLGIDEIRYCKKNPANEFAIKASNEAIKNAGISPLDIQVVIVLRTKNPEYIMSSEATKVQFEIGAKNAIAFNIDGLGCANINAAMHIVKSYLSNNSSIQNVLVTFGSNPYTNNHYRHPVTIVGNGGFGAVFTRDNSCVLDVEYQTNGKYWDIFKVETNSVKKSEWKEECTNVTKFNMELVTEGLLRYRKLINVILSRHGLTLSDINHVLMQNLSSATYGLFREYLKLPIADFIGENLKMYGHLGEMDVFLNYKTGIEKGFINNDDWVLILNNSPSACWGVYLIRQGTEEIRNG